MNKFKIAAVSILEEADKPLHVKEITKLALEKGILETEGATPESSMNTQIILDIRNKKESSDFVKTAPSTYGLNKNKKSIVSEKILITEKEEDEKVTIESGYTGKGGEHLVCSELLFRGFNASIMSVDVGMDIIATKNSKLFSVQVKTSNLNSFNTYVFDVRKVSFERHDSGNIFYIFVLHGQDKDNYLILPYFEMEKKVHEKAILEVGQGKRFRVNIKIREDNIYLGTKEHQMNYYLNNWDIIK